MVMDRTEAQRYVYSMGYVMIRGKFNITIAVNYEDRFDKKVVIEDMMGETLSKEVLDEAMAEIDSYYTVQLLSK